MAILSSSSRNKLSKSTFGLPGERKYPMPDASHASNAKARATQQVKAGNLSPSSKAKIDAKANRVLGKGMAEGGKVSLDPHSWSHGAQNTGKDAASISGAWSCPKA